MGTISVTVDGQSVRVAAGSNVLDAVNTAGVYLPQLCKDMDRPRLGTCRTCLVGIDGRSGVSAACSTPASDGMVVRTADPLAERVRQGVLQLTVDMLAETDLSRTGELATAATRHGVTRGRFGPAWETGKSDDRDESNAFWVLDHSRCILCERCLDACQNVQGAHAIALIGRGSGAKIGTFLDTPIAESICTSCGQCWSACPTHAIQLKHPVSANGVARALPASNGAHAVAREPRGDALPQIVRRVETVCPYCGVGCGMVLNVGARGEIVEVDDVPGNLSSSGMLCVKGRYGLGFVHAPDRLTTPMIRRSKGGELEPATWDEALDLVADKMIEFRGYLGLLGSAKGTNEDGYVLQKFARTLLATNNIDHCARLCHSPSMTGLMEMLGSGSTSNSYADFEQARCLLIVGSDTDANHPVVASRIRGAVERGNTALIVVNPRRIRLCDVADVWLRPKFGTDIALFNGLGRIALDNGWLDQAFIDARTEGFDEWRASLADYDSGRVADLTGVPEADLHRAAELFACRSGGTASVLWGMGITQHVHGVKNVQAMVNLALAMGHVGKPGSGLSPLRGQNNVQGCCDVGVLPDYFPGYQPAGDEARAKFGAAWGMEPSPEHGLMLTEMVDAAISGQIRAMYVTGENPMMTEANLSHAQEAFGRLDFLVTQMITPNETTELADVVLPAACFAERDGTFTNSERRVQRVRKAIDPPGDARVDWEITCDLARRVAQKLGLPSDGFQYGNVEEIWDECASLVPAFAGITYDRLERGGIQWPCPGVDHPGTPILFAETFPRGRARLMAIEQGPRAAEMPLPHYPLALNTGRVLYHWHAGDMTRRAPGLVATYPAVLASINPRDARAASVVDGQPVRLTSRRGKIVATAHVTDEVRPGDVFIPFVQLQGVAANFLTNNVHDPQAKIPEYKVCAVRIEPA